MKNFKNRLHQRIWLGVESTIRGDKTEMPVHTAAEKAIAHSHILNRCASLHTKISRRTNLFPIHSS